MRGFDSVLFDLDGTLWDASPACALAWNRSLARFRLGHRTVDAAEARSFTGLPFEMIFERSFAELPAARRKQFIEVYRVEEAESIRTLGGALYPGVHELLETLRPFVRLFVVSNCLDGYIENFYRLSGLESFFEGYECFGRTGKPKAENIASVIATYGLNAPLYVGDMAHDHEAARRNGLPFVWASYGFGSAPEAEFKITQVTDLTAVLLPP